MTELDPSIPDDYKEDEAANALLWEAVQADAGLKSQVDAIFASDSCDIEPAFLAFCGAYYHLSLVIPKDRVIYDMGCAYAVQAWFFREHAAYIGVDMLTPVANRLHLANTMHDMCPIDNWLKRNTIINPHFAICHYVPPWGGGSGVLVREAFTDLFVFYPRGSSD